MNKPISPTKEQVRDWIKHRQSDQRPLPDIKQIRRELGWDLREIASERR